MAASGEFFSQGIGFLLNPSNTYYKGHYFDIQNHCATTNYKKLRRQFNCAPICPHNTPLAPTPLICDHAGAATG